MKKVKKSTIYIKEYNILQKIQEHLNNRKFSVEELWDEYTAISNEYKQLLNTTVKITNISDKYHKKLMLAYENLEKQNVVLEEIAILREDVAQITRHDLKTPLNGILGFSSLLLMNDSKLDDQQKQMIHNIEIAGYQILEIINSSHNLYKMETGTYQYHSDFVDILSVFNKIVDETKIIIELKELKIEVKLDNKLAVENDTFNVEGEYLLCYSMFANLLKNAIEAAPSGTIITISLEEKDVAIISIHNQGVIPKEIRSKFFDKYVTAGKCNGSGLGTYSAKLMAEIQGGSIQFVTSENIGTTITVHLSKINLNQQEKLYEN